MAARIAALPQETKRSGASEPAETAATALAGGGDLVVPIQETAAPTVDKIEETPC